MSSYAGDSADEFKDGAVEQTAEDEDDAQPDPRNARVVGFLLMLLLIFAGFLGLRRLVRGLRFFLVRTRPHLEIFSLQPTIIQPREELTLQPRELTLHHPA